MKNKNISKNNIKSKFIWCAASTHDGEEEICIDTHIKLKKTEILLFRTLKVLLRKNLIGQKPGMSTIILKHIKDN